MAELDYLSNTYGRKISKKILNYIFLRNNQFQTISQSQMRKKVVKKSRRFGLANQ